MIQRTGDGLAIMPGAVRVDYGLRILENIREGDFVVEGLDGKKVPLTTDAKDWKQVLQKYASDLIELLAAAFSRPRQRSSARLRMRKKTDKGPGLPELGSMHGRGPGPLQGRFRGKSRMGLQALPQGAARGLTPLHGQAVDHDPAQGSRLPFAPERFEP